MADCAHRIWKLCTARKRTLCWLKVKQIFDPYGTLNPGVKFGSSLDDIKEMIRTDYGLEIIIATTICRGS